MPEDPIAHSELAALTRRFEEVSAQDSREFGIIKSDLTAVRLQIGNLDQKVENLGGHMTQRLDSLKREIDIDGFIDEQRTVNATMVELLSSLVGKSTDTQ
ncbi:hypothetical protein [Streptomyces sp. 35G-GA-8]|uniref:hypothetical protein n=1 Tax=Streptomyces sp. 35G-GA-8 TaxID=2939434 RepID=UPI00201F723B|nr:hypothetical protein [Streptomyces sp. 35G-GA-8]MCL7382586.1 hypothetical protein [Streptomyces sp. 35G-GA-8]